ncbi:hypothetical protein EDC04DRAFT_2601423 [Pisolithus marmoratus]|nr:hypothetical protein EDC04DRAFT_2601423 [Pisolithus marmoratus]
MQTSVTLAWQAFNQLDAAVSLRNRNLWRKQEEAALREWADNCTVMDMFEIKLNKELWLLELMSTSRTTHGEASWLAHGIKIEEAELIFASDKRSIGKHPTEINRLATACRMEQMVADQLAFLANAGLYLGQGREHTPEDVEIDGANNGVSATPLFHGEDSSEDDGMDISMDGMLPSQQQPTDPLLLLSTLLIAEQLPSELQHLADMELELHIGQANDALHGLWLALVDKAMISLHVDVESLSHYQELKQSHLTINTAVFQQNAHAHHGNQLPWFWSINIPKDTESKSWMSESVQDQWQEEEDLLICKFQWTTNFFKYQADEWGKKKLSSDMLQSCSICCYVVRQQQVYEQLAKHCSLKQQAIQVASV